MQEQAGHRRRKVVWGYPQIADMQFPRPGLFVDRLKGFGILERVERVGAWRWLAFVACVLAFANADLRQAENLATEKFSATTRADWEVTNIWITSAECARKTGAWLVICPGGKLAPIANAAVADDPGHALLLGLAARVLDRKMAVVDVARLNIAIDFAGMVCIAALLFAVRSYVASFVVLALGGDVYLSWIAISPHPGLIGAASYAAFLPCTLLLGERGYFSKPEKVVFLAAGALLFGLATLLREPIGSMGVFVCIGCLIFLGWQARDRRYWFRLLPLLALVLVSWQTPRWVLLARDVIFSIPPTSLIQTHGTSHNLYIGLGAIENKFGIQWTDADGGQAVAKVDPKAVYASQEYFRVLWREYFNRISEDPVEVARIYVTKGFTMLGYRLPERWQPLWLVLAIVVGFMILGAKLKIWRSANYGQAPLMLGVGLAFVGFFLLQGTLAHHSIGYAQPVAAFVLLFLALGVELVVRAFVLMLKWGPEGRDKGLLQ